MHVSFIQHSKIDPLKSTVWFDPRIDTRAYNFNSPGGAITIPACEDPVGFVGVYRAAIIASCNPLEALPNVYPAACPFTVVNDSVPALPSPAHVPPVTSAA